MKSTPERREFDAARKLLYGLWFIDEPGAFGLRGRVDFDAIDQMLRDVRPSTTEALRVDLARHLYTGRGTVDLAGLLARADGETTRVVLEAIATYAGGTS